MGWRLLIILLFFPTLSFSQGGLPGQKKSVLGPNNSQVGEIPAFTDTSGKIIGGFSYNNLCTSSGNPWDCCSGNKLGTCYEFIDSNGVHNFPGGLSSSKRNIAPGNSVSTPDNSGISNISCATAGNPNEGAILFDTVKNHWVFCSGSTELFDFNTLAQ